MRNEDKPFVCYKAGWSIKIIPREAAGWRAFGMWMALLAMLLIAFLAALSNARNERVEIALTIGFVLASATWAVTMIRWMMARSEVIDMAELLELKRQNDARPSRGGRREY